jgi:biopolymer transport protein ExbB/TolQ
MTRSDALEAHAAAVQRARRSWRYGMWTGAVLMTGPMVGVAIYVLAMLSTFRMIDSERAPTPKTLAVGIHDGMIAIVLGALVGAYGLALFLVCTLRLHRMDREQRAEQQEWSSS